MYMYTCIYTCIRIHIHICIYIYMYIYMYIHIYVYVYAYVYTYIYIYEAYCIWSVISSDLKSQLLVSISRYRLPRFVEKRSMRLRLAIEIE